MQDDNIYNFGGFKDNIQLICMYYFYYFLYINTLCSEKRQNEDFIMNKNKIRPPYWLLIIGGSIGIEIAYAIMILGKTKILKDFPTNYVTWFYREGIILHILYVLEISIFYLILWFRDKRYKKMNNA